MRTMTAPRSSPPAPLPDAKQFGLLQRPWLQNLTSPELHQIARRTHHSLLHLQNSLASESYRHARLLAERTQYAESISFPRVSNKIKDFQPRTIWDPVASLYAKARQWATTPSTEQPLLLPAAAPPGSQPSKAASHRLAKLTATPRQTRDTFISNGLLLSNPTLPLPLPTPPASLTQHQETLQPLVLPEAQSTMPLQASFPSRSPQALIIEATIELDEKNTPAPSTSAHLLRVTATESIEEAVEAFARRLSLQSNFSEQNSAFPLSAQAALSFQVYHATSTLNYQ